jgi:NAD-reducing hydrogenase large subunit
MQASGGKTITIEPVTRVEGHGKVTILMDESGHVARARFHVVEFRGFERFIQGRPYWEMPVAVQRLCGICPVSHHLCAAKAVDRIVGGENLTPTAEKMRRLMHYGQTYQSHALHFFHLASPDLLFGFGSDVASRHVLGVAAMHPELARQGILMRKYGQEIIKATAGKKVHGTGAIPGGINKNLSLAERDELLADLDQNRAWSLAAVKIARDYTLAHIDTLAGWLFLSNHVRPSAGRRDGPVRRRAARPRRQRKVDLRRRRRPGLPRPDRGRGQALELHEVPFLKALGPENGWYRVGPLSRVSACDFIDTPLAEAERKVFKEVSGGKPSPVTMAYHWARMIELLHSVEKIDELLHDPDLQGEDLVVKGTRRSEGIAIVEAPRGTLFHHYRVNDDDQVVMANLIVSTTSNNEPMNRAVESVARQYLDGQTITEGLLNHIEVAIRAYDPCLSCATHALGQMPLAVELVDASGAVIDRRTRG